MSTRKRSGMKVSAQAGDDEKQQAAREAMLNRGKKKTSADPMQ